MCDEDESDYVMLSDEIVPDNELLRLTELEQPLTEAENYFVELISLAACQAPTDLKARLRTLPNIIDTFYRNFEKLKAEAKNDPDRVQNEIFELYNNFFTLVKSIFSRIDTTERLLESTQNDLGKLAIRNNEISIIRSIFGEMSNNGHEFSALFEEGGSKFPQNKE